MPTIKELNEKKASLVHQMRDTLNVAEKENRFLNSDECTKNDKIKSDILEINQQIERQEELEKFEAQLRASQPDGSGLSGQMGTLEAPERKFDALNVNQKKDLAFSAWLKHNHDDYEPTKDELKAAKDLNVSLDSGDFNLSLPPKHRKLADVKNSMTVGTDSAGGYSVPDSYIANLELAILSFSSMLDTSQVIYTQSGNNYPWPMMDDTSNEGEIVAEEGDVTTQADPSMSQLTLKAWKFSSKMTQMSSEVIQDSVYDLPVLIAMMHGERIGRHMNRKFTVGTGTGEPTGIVPSAPVKLIGSSATSYAWDEVLSLITQLDEAYLEGAQFMMHGQVELALQLLKDGNGNYLWNADISKKNGRNHIRDYPVRLNSFMPSSLTASTKGILFGQLSAYKARIVRKVRVRRLTELFASQDKEAFITFMRGDGNLLNAGSNPVIALETSA